VSRTGHVSIVTNKIDYRSTTVITPYARYSLIKMDDDRLADRHIVVTGAAQGIGRGIADRVAEAGADVTIFDLKAEAAEETAAMVEDRGQRANALSVDVSDGDSVAEGVQRAVAELGPIHGLVNNAGIQRSIPILELSGEEWDEHMDVNAKGVFFCCREVAAHMIDEGTDGAIVNIASTGAERPFPGQGVYAATKAGVVGFTIVLAKELGEYGITANCINPGTVDTPMVQQWLTENAERTGASEEDFLQDALDLHILNRMGQPREIGHVATLLLSEEGDWITGEALNIDGGYTKM
jgi:NAD(P)-dependent dehydrogenase (short-subunit alcohol dehydrogenase family)